jgi:predicted outer membrane protein
VKSSYGMDEKRGPRLLQRRGFLLVGAGGAVAAAFGVVMNPVGLPASGAANLGGTVNTKWGRLSTLDRSVLVKVRQANLWEMPAGQQAQQRASSPRVREVAGIISRQHMQLDVATTGIAEELGVILPVEPNGAQKSYLREMSSKYGDDYDKTFVLRLRAAHGQVFQLLAKARAQTENTKMRPFIEAGMKFVNTHISLLESTGLVPRRALH